jgi:hypothetical protein
MLFSTYNYRFAEEVLNSKLNIKREIEEIIENLQFRVGEKGNHDIVQLEFHKKGWHIEPSIISSQSDKRTKMKLDCLKERVGVEIEFAHHIHVYHEWLKFLVASEQNLIDVGIHILLDHSFTKKWKPAAPSLQKASKELEMFFKSVISVPIYIIGIK